MDDFPKKTDGVGPGQYILKKKRHRKSSNFKKNLFWCGIILILAVIFGAMIGFYSPFFDYFFRSGDEKITVSEQNMLNKLKDIDIDRLLRKKEGSNR